MGCGSSSPADSTTEVRASSPKEAVHTQVKAATPEVTVTPVAPAEAPAAEAPAAEAAPGEAPAVEAPAAEAAPAETAPAETAPAEAAPAASSGNGDVKVKLHVDGEYVKVVLSC